MLDFNLAWMVNSVGKSHKSFFVIFEDNEFLCQTSHLEYIKGQFSHTTISIKDPNRKIFVIS